MSLKLNAKLYSLGVVDMSLTKRLASKTVELTHDWKLFCSGVESPKFAQVGVGILVSPQLANRVDEWIPLRIKVCMLKLKLLRRSLCLIQVYGPHASAPYLEFEQLVSDALLMVKTNKSTILQVEFNAYLGNDAGE